MNEIFGQPDNSYWTRFFRMFDFGQFEGIGALMLAVPLVVLLGIFLIIRRLARNKKMAYVYLTIAMVAYLAYALLYVPNFFYLFGEQTVIFGD